MLKGSPVTAAFSLVRACVWTTADEYEGFEPRCVSVGVCIQGSFLGMLPYMCRTDSYVCGGEMIRESCIL